MTLGHLTMQEFLKWTWPNPEHLPQVIFFDNNCRLMAHLRAQGDTYFEKVCLPVDVFHFKSKHKESDEFCQKHCNPALFPQLFNKQGGWRFNSSAAEQANAWIGGFLAITREMLAVRFNFFMDEMIQRRNRMTVANLRARGLRPVNIPEFRERL